MGGGVLRTLDGAGAVVGDKHLLDGLGATSEVDILLCGVGGSALARRSPLSVVAVRAQKEIGVWGEVACLETHCTSDKRTDTVGRVEERGSRRHARPTWTEPKFSLVAMVS